MSKAVYKTCSKAFRRTTKQTHRSNLESVRPLKNLNGEHTVREGSESSSAKSFTLGKKAQ